METVVSPPHPDELRLLTEWEGDDDRSRRRRAGLASIGFHGLAILVLMLLPESVTAPVQTAIARHITPLVAPFSEPTQTTPNKGRLSKEFDMESLQPRPRIHIPPSPPSTTRPAARMPSPPPRQAPPPAALAEPPRLEAGLRAPAGPAIPAPALPPPPQIQPQEAPKLAFETPAAASTPRPGRGTGSLRPPDTSIAEAIRSTVRGGSGGLTVGDVGEPGLGGSGAGINLPPSPGRQASNLELLSDPLGVDFRPYLVRILASVRRNWFAVMPESAHLGRQGRVGIQFAIARNGSVPKLVIVQQSGTEALDRAAVAGISASNPFPPLPSEFKGEVIRLQFNFAYNLKRN